MPLLWEPSFCSRSPIALGYTRGHFCALVPPEPVVGQHLAIRTYCSSTMSGAACSIQGKYDFDYKIKGFSSFHLSFKNSEVDSWDTYSVLDLSLHRFLKKNIVKMQIHERNNASPVYTEVRFACLLSGGLNIIIRHSSKIIWVIRLSFCQNDSLTRGSFWQKDSLITHILFDLWLIMIFSPPESKLAKRTSVQWHITFAKFWSLWKRLWSSNQNWHSLMNVGM